MAWGGEELSCEAASGERGVFVAEVKRSEGVGVGLLFRMGGEFGRRGRSAC